MLPSKSLDRQCSFFRFLYAIAIFVWKCGIFSSLLVLWYLSSFIFCVEELIGLFDQQTHILQFSENFLEDFLDRILSVLYLIQLLLLDLLDWSLSFRSTLLFSIILSFQCNIRLSCGNFILQPFYWVFKFCC
jgi:hypothetical protein